MTDTIPKEYAVCVATNDIKNAIAQLGSALYDLLEQSLMTADEEDVTDFEQFARDTLTVLGRYPEQLTCDDSPWQEIEPDRDHSPSTD